MKRGESTDSTLAAFSELGLTPHTIVTYSLQSLDHVKKTQFGYALKGRDGKSGLIFELKGKMLGRNCFRVRSDRLIRIEAFLDFWKVAYDKEEAYYLDSQKATSLIINKKGKIIHNKSKHDKKE
ncbi:MAG: hypothetical protein ABIC95_00405 [archaeon]